MTNLAFDFASRGAARMSACGRYRYSLTREGLGGQGTTVFVGLNPSTATAEADDATVRKCMAFCRRWGSARYVMINLFAWRSTDPRGLLAASDPVGPDNDVAIRDAVAGATRVVAAWGSHAFLKSLLPARARAVVELLQASGIEPLCLGTAQDGMPRHPLYLAGDTPLQPWRLP
jgi:hypothetical protein